MQGLLTYNYGSAKIHAMRELGCDLIYVDEKGITYDEKFEEAEVLFCYNPFSTLNISELKKLKWIQLSSIGVDQLPQEEVLERGIIITNNQGGYSIPMGEWIVMKILELYKNSASFYEKQKNKLWKVDASILELYGKTVGFLGTGTISVEAAKRLQCFGVHLLGMNTLGKLVSPFHECYSRKELPIMLPRCDVLVLALPSTKETYHLVDTALFKQMKQDTYLINIARGNILDEEALIQNLVSGKLRGAALDVFEKEPLPQENPLWELPNVSITPHNCWISEMRNIRRYELIYENLRRYIQGEQLLNVVDLKKGY